MSTFRGGSYSTSETLTGETWIDGRPIYRKVEEVTSNFSDTITIGSNINMVILARGILFTPSGASIHINFYPSDDDKTQSASFYIDASKRIVPSLGSARLSAATKIIWIVEYTKT